MSSNLLPIFNGFGSITSFYTDVSIDSCFKMFKSYNYYIQEVRTKIWVVDDKPMGSYLEVELEEEFPLMENHHYIFHRQQPGRDRVTYHTCHKDLKIELASIFPVSHAIHFVELEIDATGDFKLLALPTVTSEHTKVITSKHIKLIVPYLPVF